MSTFILLNFFVKKNIFYGSYSFSRTCTFFSQLFSQSGSNDNLKFLLSTCFLTAVGALITNTLMQVLLKSDKLTKSQMQIFHRSAFRTLLEVKL